MISKAYKPLTIRISGPQGAGKSTLAIALRKQIKGKFAIHDGESWSGYGWPGHCRAPYQLLVYRDHSTIKDGVCTRCHQDIKFRGFR